MTDSDKIEEDLSDLLFGVRRSVLYHNRRRSFYENLRNIKNILSVIFGSATFFAVLGSAGRAFTLTAAAIVTILSTIDLVVGTSNKARLHSDLAKRFIQLEKSIIGTKEPTAENLREWIQERLEIETEEPPKLRVLDSLCHNDLCRAMGYDQSESVNVRPVQRLFAQVIDIGSHRIQRNASLLQSTESEKNPPQVPTDTRATKT
jgi:hypothetical protein